MMNSTRAYEKVMTMNQNTYFNSEKDRSRNVLAAVSHEIKLFSMLKGGQRPPTSPYHVSNDPFLQAKRSSPPSNGHSMSVPTSSNRNGITSPNRNGITSPKRPWSQSLPESKLMTEEQREEMDLFLESVSEFTMFPGNNSLASSANSTIGARSPSGSETWSNASPNGTVNQQWADKSPAAYDAAVISGGSSVGSPGYPDIFELESSMPILSVDEEYLQVRKRLILSPPPAPMPSVAVTPPATPATSCDSVVVKAEIKEEVVEEEDSKANVISSWWSPFLS